MRIRQVFGLGAAVGLVTAFATACAAKKPLPFPDVLSFCNAKAQAECQIATTCLISSSDCEAERASLCNEDASQAVRLGGVRQYTQANAQRCIDAVNSAYGNGHTSVSYMQLIGPGSITDLCERVFAGNASMDDPCQSSYDCTGNLVCAPTTPGASADGGSGSFVCAPPTQVAEGAFCTTPGSVCATNTYCGLPAAGGGTYICEASMQVGQPCSDTEPCVSTARCKTATGVTTQTCEARATIGQDCVTSDDCDPSAPYCDPYLPNQCAPGLSFAAHAPDCMAFTSAGADVSGSSAADAGAGASDAGGASGD